MLLYFNIPNILGEFYVYDTQDGIVEIASDKDILALARKNPNLFPQIKTMYNEVDIWSYAYTSIEAALLGTIKREGSMYCLEIPCARLKWTVVHDYIELIYNKKKTIFTIDSYSGLCINNKPTRYSVESNAFEITCFGINYNTREFMIDISDNGYIFYVNPLGKLRVVRNNRG